LSELIACACETDGADKKWQKLAGARKVVGWAAENVVDVVEVEGAFYHDRGKDKPD
jgi:hypothetical protein